MRQRIGTIALAALLAVPGALGATTATAVAAGNRCVECKLKVVGNFVKKELVSCDDTTTDFDEGRFRAAIERCELQTGCFRPDDGFQTLLDTAMQDMRATREKICPVPCGLDPQSGLCGGDCDTGSTCVWQGERCLCEPQFASCESPSPAVPLYCPGPCQTCVGGTSGSPGTPGVCTPAGGCPCQADGAGVCGGDCPDGFQCAALQGASGCSCFSEALLCDSIYCPFYQGRACPAVEQTCTDCVCH
jgi:hypothetical protein